ncbi:MAG: glycogen synthase GlgA [Clostridia bacterium]|nr:glycogen synthase GlgA [Clostridia bacterium]
MSTTKQKTGTKTAQTKAEETKKTVPVAEKTTAAKAPKVAPKATPKVVPKTAKKAPKAPVVIDDNAPEVEVVQTPTEAKVEEVVPEVHVEAKKKILFVASEAAPFIATGGLAEVIGSLSKALAKEERYDVRVMIPLYQDIKKEYRKEFKFIGNIFVPLSWRNQYCGIFEYEANNVKFYFLDNEYYFKRPGCYGYYDDGERFAFFCRGVMEVLSFIGFYPDVLHCHDWQAALAALYLKTIYCYRPEYQYIRALFTIHNIEYQGKYSLDILEDLFGISNRFRNLVEYDRCINLMKGAIECCERFSTVSPTYAGEIKDPYYSHGLDPIIRRNEFKLCGILNGIDPDYYNPETDSSLFYHYSAANPAPKAKCKEELQRMLNLPVKADTPIIAMISRLVSHKGLDLVKEEIEQVLRDDVQFILLGTGDSAYENYFSDLARRYQGKVVSIISFNADLSRKIYSGADIFLMPSKSEPCGLSQMIASRYGTVSIVRETGGLRDSITPYGAGGNGFTFRDYNAHDMLYVINEALEVYHNSEEWAKLVKKAMNTDFSWSTSAKYYEGVYLGMLN